MTERFLGYGRQSVNGEEKQAVCDVLDSDYLTQGPKVAEFERMICELTGAQYAVAVSSGTSALQCAVAALSIPEGSSGITSPNTFLASANAMVYNKIKPLFADIDEQTYNIIPKTIARQHTDDTRVLIPVHFAGQPCRMEEIGRYARENGLYIIEDAAHALGSRSGDGSMVGNCRFSDMTVFSFHPVKTVTTAEGGMITTNSRDLYHRLRSLREHGIVRDAGTFRFPERSGPWYHEMQHLGYNCRMSDLHAAIGCVQLEKLAVFADRRREIVERYNDAFSDVSWLKTPFERPGIDSVFHLYVLRVDFSALGMSRTEVMDTLRTEGIGTQVHYIPVYLQPYYMDRFKTGPGLCPAAEKYYEQALSIPLFPDMDDSDVSRVIRAITALKHIDKRIV